MATLVTKSIGSGGGRDYSTIALWEDATDIDLVATDQIQQGELYNDSEFSLSAEVVFAGSTVDSTRYRVLTTAAGQSFMDDANQTTNPLRYDQSKGVGIKGIGSYLGGTLSVQEAWFRMSKIQMQRSGGWYAIYSYPAGGQQYLNMLIECTSTGQGIFHIETLDNGKAVNCVVIDRTTNGVQTLRVQYAFATGGIFNCTVVRPSDKTTGGIGIIFNSGGNVKIKNCAVFGFTTNFSGTAASGSGYNATDSVTAPGSNNQTSLTYASQFQAVTDASRDYRAVDTGSLDLNGTRDQTDTNDLDIVGQSRSITTPTIGCWELVVASVAASPPRVMRLFEGFKIKLISGRLKIQQK